MAHRAELKRPPVSVGSPAASSVEAPETQLRQHAPLPSGSAPEDRALSPHQGHCARLRDVEGSIEGDDNELSALAFNPEPFRLARGSSWIKPLLLFFDDVAILLPDYMGGREFVADPSLRRATQPSRALQDSPAEWFVDAERSRRLAEGRSSSLSAERFEGTAPNEDPFSMSECLAELSAWAEQNRSPFDMTG